jgi:putative ABC transport system substrate-binding protein
MLAVAIWLALWSVAGHAVAAERMRHVGVLISGNEAHRDVRHRLVVFIRAMQAIGWVEGRNVRYEVRWGNSNHDRLSAAAAELHQLAPNAVLSIGTPATRAMHLRSKTIPLVFAIVSDPIGDGFLESLSHPGGNVTGFITYYPEFVEKWIGLLKEAVPQTRRTGLLVNPRTAPFSSNQCLRPYFETAARRLAIEPAMLPVASEIEIETAVTAIMQKPGGSLIVMPDSFMIAHRDTILGLAAKHKVPVIYPFAPFALKGGLMAYGVNMADLTRRAAGYVDRVLKGEKAASLPVQLPTKFELVVNIKAAKAIRLDIPLSVLVQATEVIE